MQTLHSTLERVVRDVFNVDIHPELTRPDEQFGDYSTNVALQLAGRLRRSPREVAEELQKKLEEELGDTATAVSIAGPGFINIRLADSELLARLDKATDAPQSYAGKEIVAEYSDANPFKVLHAGHVYTTVVGDAIANLLEHAGATVHRVNFGGDVGLHVGKTMWAITEKLGGEHPEKLAEIPEADRAAWMAECYVQGERAYNDSEEAKARIIVTNKHVYQLHTEHDHDSPFAQIYWTCRQWSYEAFDVFFARFGTKLEKYYPESEVADLGLQTVKEHIGPVFEKSEGAIVFNGEKYGLHTRVFINQQGLPTYEAKDVGLIARKYEDYHFDRSVIITDNEQAQYMQVVLKAIEQFWPDFAHATTHLTHGKVKLAGGVKMSSRKGNIIRASEVLDMTVAELQRSGRSTDDSVMLGAVKYAFLKTRIGGDIIYDPKESIALEGNSGPYLQYAHARARSVLAKAPDNTTTGIKDLQPDERSLARKITEYPEVLQQAIDEMMPHHICTYLYELAQSFNRFYEHNRVVGDPRQSERLTLVGYYAAVLKDGLQLLGITAPEHM